ncbi:hypothetical protein I4U23_009036 [Adineta vaga]|nr:hypothetical protein I4U23_009036 [Adineta vaga]
MKQSQNNNTNIEQEHGNERNSKLVHRRKLIVFIFIAIIAGLSLIAAIILVSIEFNQIYRRSREISELEQQTSNTTDASIFKNSTTSSVLNSIIITKDVDTSLINTSTTTTTRAASSILTTVSRFFSMNMTN